MTLAFIAIVAGFNLLRLSAHEAGHVSVHDTVAGIVERMKREMPADQLLNLTVPKVEAFLTAQERRVLATEHVRFDVNQPVVVTILRDTSQGEEPFWLRERGFQATGFKTKLSNHEFDAWEKAFPAGEIGLGIHNFSARGTHYFVLLRPQRAGDPLKVDDFYPAQLRAVPFVAGVEPYVDEPIRLNSVPAELQGQILVQTLSDSEEDARLVSLFNKTHYPATDHPDQVVLTWSEDPRTSQTVQWRTSSTVKQGLVRYQVKSAGSALDAKTARVKSARTRPLATPTLINDPLVMRHTAVLTGLKPATTYLYAVGDGSPSSWSETAEFTTAPAGAVPFSFVYMGDAQNGLDTWGKLLHHAAEARPDAAFYLMAGDMLNRGAERWDWDSFFFNAKGVFDHRTLVPVLGNHEYQGGEPKLFLAQLMVRHNGPRTIPAGRAYSFEYSNAKFVILDSNLDAAAQSAWLEKELAHTKAVWKFVSYHHPAYSSGGNRDNLDVRRLWTPIFDKYHVDLAMQGHDHAYLRTYPMNGQQRVASPKEGTIYVISVSGTKHYAQPPHDYTEVGFTKISTYQVLDIQIDGNRLVYRSHDVDGKVRDEFVIQK